MVLEPSQHNVLVIIPAFNEETTIRSVLSSIRDLYPEFDIAVIDDGSTDQTVGEVQKTDATLIQHPFNLGYGSAIQTGYMYAEGKSYDYLVQIDGDGQHDPRSLVDLLSPVVQNEADITLGSRFIKAKSYKPSFFRISGILVLRFMTFVLCGVRISDPTTGYQAMNMKVMKLFCSPYFPKDYPDADVIILLKMADLRFKEVAVTMYESIDNKSMHSGLAHSLYYMFKMILSMLLMRFRKIKA